jgi:5-methylthioadenosine/S-adenosylhomocysteine deaminase
MKTLIKNGTIVTNNRQNEVFVGDVIVSGRAIQKISKKTQKTSAEKFDCIIDATDQFVIPGFVQAHTHLCQTLFRGEADDLALIDWLKEKIWPMEAAHNKASMRASALYGSYEMQMNGTTTILDMGSVKHTQALLEAVSETGLRYWGGKCLMDRKGSVLSESTRDALKETAELKKEWAEKHALINYALCPRFVVSCTEGLLQEVQALQASDNLMVHTHASENLDEIKLVKQLTKMDNVSYLDKLKLLNPRTAIAHAIHLTSKEVSRLAKTKTPIVHCPSSNMKLGSGLAPITQYLKRGITIGLGADGAPCNNSMDPFKEMHLAAILQKPVFGPTAMDAKTAFELATLGGAKTLGVAGEIGSLEVGKLADIVTVDRSHPSVYTVTDPYSALVYSCTGRDVRDVLIDGKLIIRNRVHQLLDRDEVFLAAKTEKASLLKRI